MRAWLLILASSAVGCSGVDPCATLGTFSAGGGAEHLASCDDPGLCGNATDPPTAGAHCTAVLACRVYSEPQSRCAWIHNLEHGHAVLAYNCPEGCPDVVAELTAIREASPHRARILITPDPLLGSRVGAAVWGYGYAGEQALGEAIRCVLDRQDDHAPEAGLGCPQ